MSEITNRLEICLPSNQPRKERRRPEIKTPITSHSRITKSGGGALLQPKDAPTSRHGQTGSQHSHTTTSGTEQSLQDQGRARPIHGMISYRPHNHKETGFPQQRSPTTRVEQEGLETCEPTTIERSSLSETVPTRITAIITIQTQNLEPPVFSGPAEPWGELGASGRPMKRRRALPNSTHHGTSDREHIRGQLNGKEINEISTPADSNLSILRCAS